MIYRMNLASFNRWSSFDKALRFGSENRRGDCLTGLAPRYMLSVCLASSLVTPDMHVRWTPGKDLPVLTEELNERACLYDIEVSG
jgi:hypothetical protein